MTELFPERRSPPPEPRRKDFTILVVLLILGVLTAILWFADPAHQWPGRSRVDWPPATPAKP
jgi:hypothetical protein